MIVFAVRNSVRVGLLLFVAFCCVETHAQAPHQPNATYHSDAMNLDFSYPSNFAKQGVDESAKNYDRLGILIPLERRVEPGDC